VDAIEKSHEYITQGSACGLISDLANHMGDNIKGCMDPFVNCLNRVLSTNDFANEVKLKAITALSDISLACGNEFQKHLHNSVSTILKAASVSVSAYDMKDPALVEYMAQLREAIVDAFISVIHGQSLEDLDQRILGSYLQNMIQYVYSLLQCQDQRHSLELQKSMVDLVIDVVNLRKDLVMDQLRNFNLKDHLLRQISKDDFQRDGDFQQAYVSLTELDLHH